MSFPLGGEFDRQEDEALAARFLEPVETRSTVSSSANQRQTGESPVAAKTALSPEFGGSAKARRTADGKLDFEHPVDMCQPVRRLWNEGDDDQIRFIS